MLQAALRSGAAERRSVFEVFARRLPDGRRYGVVAGTGRLLDAIEDVPVRRRRARPSWPTHTSSTSRPWTGWPTTASPATSGATARATATSRARRSWSSRAPSPRPCCSRPWSCRILNHDSADRVRGRPDDRPPPAAGPASRWAPAAPTSGPPSRPPARRTSPASRPPRNLEAGRRYGVPTVGTAAHAFTLLHDDEREAFEAQVAALGPETTLLVDTYDVAAAVRTAVEIAGPGARRRPARLRRPGDPGPRGPRS